MAGEKRGSTLHQSRHPEYNAYAGRWRKWRLCYEGSDEFRKAYLEQYSKREQPEDFARRSKLTYIPGHARSSINIIRNALAVQLPEVERKGSESYLDAMSRDVDTFRSSMSSFVALEITPWLLVQGKQYVVLDAPQIEGVMTVAEDSGRPYLFTVGAEDMLSWAYDSDGRIMAALVRLHQDSVDPVTKLVTGSTAIFRYYRQLGDGEPFTAGKVLVNGPGVLVWEMDKDGKEIRAPYVLDLDRVPITEFRSVASLMSEIADHQISLLNLASTDMDFLWRGNFPIYTEQLPRGAGTIRPKGTKRRTSQEVDIESGGDNIEPGSGKSDRQRSSGVGKGIGYREGMDRPDFIAPDVENLKASMEKQDALATEIRVLTNLSLTSLSVKALEQSGASKEADRVGEEAGLAYLGRVLETGERDIADLWAMMEGSDPSGFDVKYPESYTLKTEAERQEEAEKLRALRSAVRSKTYKQVVDMAIAQKVARSISTPEQIKQMNVEIEQAPYFDDDAKQAETISKDLVNSLVSTETASKLRGYPEGEARKASAEREESTRRLMAGEGAP